MVAEVVVGPCGVGRGLVVEGGVSSCVSCVDGTSSDVVSFDPCESLPTCPDNTLRLVSNSSASPCVCERGFWVVSGRVDEVCEACPVGGVCAGGVTRPVAAAGYFPEEGGGVLFLACPNPEACAGGWAMSGWVPGQAVCAVC